MLLMITGVVVIYIRLRHHVSKTLTSWQGTYRPEMQEDRDLLKKQAGPLL
jgi:hypothetical protein